MALVRLRVWLTIPTVVASGHVRPILIFEDRRSSIVARMEQIDVSGASAVGMMWQVSPIRERQKRSDRVHKGGDPAG
jgi:hypothetical protein